MPALENAWRQPSRLYTTAPPGLPEHELEPAFHRDVGAGEKPGEEDAGDDPDRLARHRQRKAVVDRVDDAGAGKRLAPAVETIHDRAAGLADLKAVQQQEKERCQDEKRNCAEQEAQQQNLHVEAERRGARKNAGLICRLSAVHRWIERIISQGTSLGNQALARTGGISHGTPVFFISSS